ncbi:MAG: hypothetical protein CMP23_02470 [Rickettsiales bacterium]|nr:hypothetical protein [Rickettsiales bacterium]
MLGRKGPPPSGGPRRQGGGGRGRGPGGGQGRGPGAGQGQGQGRGPGGRAAPGAPPAPNPGNRIDDAKTDIKLTEVIDCLYDGKDAFFRYVHTVADVMTLDPLYLTMDHRIGDGREFIAKHKVEDIPVVDEEKNKQGEVLRRHFVGMVSKRLVARMFSSAVGTLGQTDADDAFLNEPLASMIRLCRDVSTVEPSDSIVTAVDILFDENIDTLPVVQERPDGGRTLVGLVTKSSLLACFVRMESLRRARNVRPKGVRFMDVMRGQKGSMPTEILLDSAMVKVADIMRESPTTINKEDTLSRALELMEQNEVRYLPVIEKGELVGLVSDFDIASQLPPPDKDFVNRKGAETKFLENLFLINREDKDTMAVLGYKIGLTMTEDPIAEGTETRWLEVAELLYNSDAGEDIGAVPVIDDATERVSGMVTEREILGVIQTLGRMVGKR